MCKKILMVAVFVLMFFVLEACGNGEISPEGDSKANFLLENKETDDYETSESEVNENNSGETDVVSDSSVLIAYFSWSGNTKQLAEMIHEQLGGELFEIEPEIPYTNDINELSGIALQEQRDNIRPELRGTIEDINQYDVIFIGFPNWWNNMPMPVFTFLEEYDFSDKMVIPFTTYGNGVWGKSVDSIQKVLPDAVVLEGIAIQEHELQDAHTEVSEWLKNLGFVK